MTGDFVTRKRIRNYINYFNEVLPRRGRRPEESLTKPTKSEKDRQVECEVCLDGWRTLARMLSCSESKIRRKKAELMSIGVIFERLKGRPPRKVISFFPSVVMKSAELKARYGERV